MKKNWTLIIICFLILLLALSNLALSSVFYKGIKGKIELWQKENQPISLSLTYLTVPDCDNCFDLTSFVDFLLAEGIEVVDERKIPYNTGPGQQLIKKYQITRVPTILVEGDIKDNQALLDFYGYSGEVVDQVFVMRNILPRYYDLQEDKIVGDFQVFYLTDAQCDSCYDVTLHANALENLAMFTDQQKSYDINSPEGRQLVEKYNIEYVPTLLLKGDLSGYQALVNLWPQLGTVEEDGTYVFREGVFQMGTYKDLTENKIIENNIQEDTE